MAGLLAQQGYEFDDDAELVVINSCTVKGPTDTAFSKQLRELDSLGKKVIVTGCIPQSDRRRAELNGRSLVGTYDIDRIVEVAEATEAGQALQIVGRENRSRLNLPKRRSDPNTEIVPILHGCASSCSFCKTKHARGQLFSYPIPDIIRHGLVNGVGEMPPQSPCHL